MNRMGRKRRPHLAESEPPTQPVRVTRRGLQSLHPLVRAKALEIAKGDAMLVHVVSHTEAIVR